MKMQLPEFGFDLEMKVHLTSEKMGHDADVIYTLPKHKIPTKEVIDAALRHCIAQANETGNVDDFELVTLESAANIATPRDLMWDLGEPAA